MGTVPDSLIVWAEEEGGVLKAKWGSEADYEEIVQNGIIITGFGFGMVQVSKVNYVAFTKIKRDHDFTLGGPREAETS